MPIQASINSDPQVMADGNEFRAVPRSGDLSKVQAVLESARIIARKSDLSHDESIFIQLLLKYAVGKVIMNDLLIESSLPTMEKMMVTRAMQNIAYDAGRFGNDGTSKYNAAMTEMLSLFHAMESRIHYLDDDKVNLPKFETSSVETFTGIVDLDFFGRLRREFSVEALAGTSSPPPILRPIELTLVPDRLTNFLEMTTAMRNCLNLCVLMSNQRNLIRNSYTLRLCLIEHLFVRVIPLPLPVNHPERNSKCFWHAQSMRYETQADCLRTLNMLCRHFITASLSVKMTRSGDAVRMLVLACMATVCDAAMRKIACDVPAQSSLHYSGVAPGPIKPYGFSIGTFAEESEYLKFVTPEMAAARTQVLDYFHHLKSIIPPENYIFKFNEGRECSLADRRFVDQLCLQMGYQRGLEKQYLTGLNRAFLDFFPEVGYLRDLVFSFKLVMVPTSEQLPELRPWTPEDAALNWGLEEEGYLVKGFGRTLDCIQSVVPVEEQQLRSTKTQQNKGGIIAKLLKFMGIKGRTPRSIPSQANPSILLGERVETEDDILHIRTLPDFDGTLGARDCEHMLQYLTVPYLRIPFLLTFFSNEIRLKALRNVKIQEVLDAALFEPGAWQDNPVKTAIAEVPVEAREHLCSSVGLLFNELMMAPKLVLQSIQTILERVVDMDTGKYSSISESILYAIRLVIRVEGFILFLGRNREYKKKMKASSLIENTNESKYYGSNFEADVRGLECSEEAMVAAIQCQKQLRQFLNEQVFKVVARWIKKSKDEGHMAIACKLYAHMAYLFRNIQPEELNSTIVFSIMACQIFLFNRYKYDLDLDADFIAGKKLRKDIEDYKDDLGIPQVELFDLFQLHRVKIMDWFISHPDERNEVSPAALWEFS